MKGGFFLLNGKFHKEDEAVFCLADLPRPMEGFSEAFRAEHNEILFPQSISKHLLAIAAATDTDLTGYIDPEGRLLRKDVSRLLNKNKLYLAARIEIRIFPSDTRLNILLQAKDIERGYYPFREPGLLLSFFRDRLKEIQPTSSYSSAGFLYRQGARLTAEESNKPNMILMNTLGCPCESLIGSFGYLNKETVIFPSADSGGYRCAILDEVIRGTKEAGFQTVERDKITVDELLQAEEIFLFDACNGIQKVLGLEEQRYFSNKTQLIAAKLSEMARKDREGKI